MSRNTSLLLASLSLYSLISASAALAEPSNVDAAHKYTWGENIGWINLDDPSKYVGIGCRAHYNGEGFLTFEDFDAFVAAFEACC